MSLALWLWALISGAQECYGTRFGDPGDKLGSEPAIALGRPVGPQDMGIAHRRWPMGTRVLVCLEARCTIGTVIDRGPYGAVDAEGRWYNYAPRYRDQITRTDLEYRGCVDLAPGLADVVGLQGRRRVRIARLPF